MREQGVDGYQVDAQGLSAGNEIHPLEPLCHESFEFELLDVKLLKHNLHKPVLIDYYDSVDEGYQLRSEE